MAGQIIHEALDLKMIIAWVYILTNTIHTVLYVGSTVDLAVRMWEHQTKQYPKSFTAQYNVQKLIYFEEFVDIRSARLRESFIKKKTRDWKMDLINRMNPSWVELDPTAGRSAQLY